MTLDPLSPLDALRSLEITARDRMDAISELVVRAFYLSPDAVIIADTHSRMVLVNQQAMLMFGYAENMMVGQPLEILIPDTLKLRHREHYADYMNNPHHRELGIGMVLHAQRSNGYQFPVEINLAPVVTNKGTFVIATIRRVHRVTLDIPVTAPLHPSASALVVPPLDPFPIADAPPPAGESPANPKE